MEKISDNDGFITYSRRKNKEMQRFFDAGFISDIYAYKVHTASKLVSEFSYKQALTKGTNILTLAATVDGPSSFGGPEVALHEGKPALIFNDEMIVELTRPFKYALIGKFSQRRPNMQEIRDHFKTLCLNGINTLALIDQRHIFINLSNQEDFAKLFSKTLLLIKGCQMRILKWSPDFDFEKESPIKPVWIQFPTLRIHFMNLEMLTGLGNLFGSILKVDVPTLSLTRPFNGCVLVEMDVTNQFENKVWLGTDKGYLQKVVYMNRPKYCSSVTSWDTESVNVQKMSV